MSPSSDYSRVQEPSLNIAGWHDILLGPVLASCIGVGPHGGPAAAEHIIGPWSHKQRHRRLR